ncbi:hypothetical protein BH23GEM9_BH23GEM9_19050 [soil metagenome]
MTRRPGGILQVCRRSGALLPVWRLPALIAALAVGTSCGDGVTDVVMEEGGFLTLAVGGEHACGTSAGGSLFCWGDNRAGQLGTGGEESSDRPVRASTNVRFASVAAGLLHSCGIDADGGLYCWGENSRGQIGNESRVNQSVPVRVAPDLKFAQVSAGWFHTCGLTVEGVAYCWGAAGQSQLGGGPGVDVLEPRQVNAPVPFSVISAGGFHTCTLAVGGRAFCWGSNQFGQIGNGNTADSADPEAVAGSGVYTSISAGYSHSCGVRSDLRPFCWGSSAFGELGYGGVGSPGTAGSTVPVALHGGISAAMISAGYYAGCLTDVQGLGWCWGRGEDGQLGTGSTWDSWTPQYVSIGIVGGSELSLTSVGTGLRHACGLSLTGVAYCWGSGRKGQLGAGSLSYTPLAVRVSAAR